MEIKLDFLKPKKNFKKKDNPAIDPNLYWRIMLFSALFIVFASLGFGFYLVKQVNKDSDFPIINAKIDGKIVKKERIEKVIEYFNLRAKKYEEISNQTNVTVFDPSI